MTTVFISWWLFLKTRLDNGLRRADFHRSHPRKLKPYLITGILSLNHYLVFKCWLGASQKVGLGLLCGQWHKLMEAINLLDALHQVVQPKIRWGRSSSPCLVKLAGLRSNE